MIRIDESRGKDYASEANLMKALARLGLDDTTPGILIVRKTNGRWTAIFGYPVHGTAPAHFGFFTWDAR